MLVALIVIPFGWSSGVGSLTEGIEGEKSKLEGAFKKIEGLDGVADPLKELWISYNNIEKLAGIEKLKALEILFMCAPPPFLPVLPPPAAADAGPLVAGRTTT